VFTSEDIGPIKETPIIIATKPPINLEIIFYIIKLNTLSNSSISK
jgi:hypothetical protein